MTHTKTGRPARGSRVPANSNGKATRQTEREPERQPLRSYSQHHMNHTKTGRQCYKCDESHSTSDCRHHSRNAASEPLTLVLYTLGQMMPSAPNRIMTVLPTVVTPWIPFWITQCRHLLLFAPCHQHATREDNDVSQ